MNHIERAQSLIDQMTVEEKSAQLYSVWLEINGDGSFSFRAPLGDIIQETDDDPRDVMRNGIGQITRPLGTRPIDPHECVKGLNTVQKFLMEETRLGIPAIPHEECLPGLMAKGATLMPAAINYGALWDEELMEKIAKAIGTELYSVGGRQGLSPVLDVCRDVRWGRTEETFGEDPYLTGCMASAFVRGLQGRDRRVLATLKHFVGHGFSEGGRNHAPVRIGERELNDTSLLPFEMAVKLANAGSVMPAYHDIDGEPSTSSHRYITEVLREQWGFDGIVVSDYMAIKLLYEHHRVALDRSDAAALALKAGLDQELPDYTCNMKGLQDALSRGMITMEELNAAVKRVLIEKSRLGLFEKPYADIDNIILNTPEHKSIAAVAAEKSIVLLKNDGALPLNQDETIALIGPLADDQLAVFCGYSFPVHLIFAAQDRSIEGKFALTLKEAFESRLESGKLLYARGCDILTERTTTAPVFPGDENTTTGRQATSLSYDSGMMDEAVSLALCADKVVVAVGDLAGIFMTGTVGEGSDTSSLELPGVQQELLKRLLANGKPVIVVLMSGRPYNLGDGFMRASAALEAFLPGQEGAKAIVDILYGKINPSGRLPVSVPKTAGAMPYYYNHKMKSGGFPIQSDFGAVYSFGHGLSYSTFEYSDFIIRNFEVPVDGTIEVSCKIRNTSSISGDEVVQLYVRDCHASLVRPVKELKGFKRVYMAGGETLQVRFSLPTDMLGFTVSWAERIVEPGDIEIMIGSSSDDIRFRSTIGITGEMRKLPSNWRMTCTASVRRINDRDEGA